MIFVRCGFLRYSEDNYPLLCRATFTPTTPLHSGEVSSISYRVYGNMTYDSPVWIFISEMLKITNVIIIFFIYWFKKKILLFL